jgi:hypothetical protein
MAGVQSPGEKKRRSLPFDRFGPNTAAMSMNDPLRGHQSCAQAFEIFTAVQPLEQSEQFMRVLHIKSHTVVADKHGQLAVHDNFAHRNDRSFARFAEFQRVRNDIRANPSMWRSGARRSCDTE